jgi:hypothetical protein
MVADGLANLSADYNLTANERRSKKVTKPQILVHVCISWPCTLLAGVKVDCRDGGAAWIVEIRKLRPTKLEIISTKTPDKSKFRDIW